ncbi:MAG: urease accessory protein UreD, partial [Nitrospiraceae bacterium]
STPSANRVYRSLSEVSVQAVEISVGPGAILEWVPEPTIPFAGSRFRQVIHVTLSPGATVLLWDAIASGRIARGERWAFTSLENEIRVTTASGASVLERYDLAPRGDYGQIGLAEAWDYVGSLYVVGDAVGADTWRRLEARLATILDERPGRVLGGVSQPALPGLAAKVLARSAPDLNATLEAMWGAARKELWSLPAAVLRRY